MSVLLTLAAGEWRFWLRSRLVLAGFIIMACVLAVTSLVTVTRIDAVQKQRLEHQVAAEERFLAQPDRHPHRMVHYGHYAYRAPGPLAIIDPGVDRVTGQSIFLEGHRQNSAMFAETRSGAVLGRFVELTPAVAYQVLAPLLLIILGHSLIIREREAGTLAPLLAQGVRPVAMLGGKALALASVILAMTVPLMLLAVRATLNGESAASAFNLVGAYTLYLLIWGGLILLVSTLARHRGIALGILAAFWVISTIIFPRLAASYASVTYPAAGKIETDLMMARDIREVGDGHDASAPTHDHLREQLLSDYGVARVEDLPVNFRGMVALASEEKLTRLLNQYADDQMLREQQQAALVHRFGWVSPFIALGNASRALAGSDLAGHHRFLREAEALRFSFVQGLNTAHAHDLSYADDANRNRDDAAMQQARVSAENWKVLSDFRFTPSPPEDRLKAATPFLMMLTVWAAGMLAVLGLAAGRLRP
ncbi:MAG: delta 1-pyrroline-5-carboxylate reductase [Alphaproteobacteria bacterium HGW-Alphaproteobacteria-18]|nr:MAG: delta 1-pyrroline-5-carboxylate reductase [Alphaproteobacteria bacterium HGW-Alphaproteobacteria-18]